MAKMGGFRSPNGMQKPMVKGPGMAPKKPGRALASPMGGAMPPSGMGGPGFKKGGLAKKKAKK